MCGGPLHLVLRRLRRAKTRRRRSPRNGTDAGPRDLRRTVTRTSSRPSKAEGSAAAPARAAGERCFAPGAADKELTLGDPAEVRHGPTRAPRRSCSSIRRRRSRQAARGKGRGRDPDRASLRDADRGVSSVTTEPVEKTDPAAAGPPELFVKAASAKLAAQQPGQLPPGLDKQIGKLRGSRFKLQVDEQRQPRDGARAGKGRRRVAAARAARRQRRLRVRAPAVPTVPMGKDGFWMVDESRAVRRPRCRRLPHVEGRGGEARQRHARGDRQAHGRRRGSSLSPGSRRTTSTSSATT